MIGALCTIFLSKSFLEAEHLIQTIGVQIPCVQTHALGFLKDFEKKWS